MKNEVIGWQERVSVGPDSQEFGVLAFAHPMPDPAYPGSECFADEAEFAAEGEYQYLVPMADPVWSFIETHESKFGYEPFALTW